MSHRKLFSVSPLRNSPIEINAVMCCQMNKLNLLLSLSLEMTSVRDLHFRVKRQGFNSFVVKPQRNNHLYISWSTLDYIIKDVMLH